MIETELQTLARPDLWEWATYQTSKSLQPDAIRLHCNENPWAPQASSCPGMNRYPDQQPAQLVQRLAELSGVSPECLLVTRGADDGIDLLVRAFCQPGEDRIIQCPPTFVMYEFFARLQGVQVQNVPLMSEAFQVDFVRLQEALGKLIFLCSPNNPTGSVTNNEVVIQLAESKKDQSVVVVDEAYVEFASLPSLARAATERSNLVVLKTLSKAWSLAGARLGFVIGHPRLIQYLKTVLTPYPMSQASIDVAVRSLTKECETESRRRIDVICERRETVRQSLQQFSFVQKVFPSHGNFLLVKVDHAKRFMQFINQQGFLIRDQSSQPGLENCVRISIGASDEMQMLLKQMKRYQEVQV